MDKHRSDDTDEEVEVIQGNVKQNSEDQKKKRKRRSKHEAEGRSYKCDDCGKSYLSQPALNNHKNTKHLVPEAGVNKKSRGRPRKYADSKSEVDDSIFTTFFSKDHRKKIPEESYNTSDIVKLVFDDIFMKYSTQCFNQLMHYTDHPVLQMLFNEVPINQKEKNVKTCDDIFYEYINFVKERTNKNYFILVLKFILLFRECMNFSRQTPAEPDTNGLFVVKKEYSSHNQADTAPDLCNEFVTEFLENNDYFGIESENDRNEIIELIQHFCSWLHLNQYTQSRLSRIS